MPSLIFQRYSRTSYNLYPELKVKESFFARFSRYRLKISKEVKKVMKLGNPEIARRLLITGANPDLKDSTGFAVIHDAARAGFLDTLQTLLEFNADVNIEDNDGNLPLHLAAREGHLPVVEFLIKHTASKVEHQNKKGDTAYDLAKLYKRNDVVKLMEGSSLRAEAADMN
ncbi:cyclin-dependent kinase 4 inhibitor C isoform X2 [Lepidochelys kempii]|uniref:cyclin-dependent kinase 4 inhibitor C isoform X2 n=1 Tax=Lepidochelys kempii TaxID=8472 RepID=UPI003C6EA7D2